MRPAIRTLPAISCYLLLACSAQAAVKVIHVVDRTDVLDGRSFGTAGPYERIVGKAHFLIDPKLPANGIITDIGRAPVNKDGLVEFSADIHVLKPRDPAKGNGTLLFEVSNRGRKGLMSMFNLAGVASLDPAAEPDFGDKFLLEQGFTLVWMGWQPDVPHQPGLMRLQAPRLEGVKGLVRSEYYPAEKVTSFSLADRNHIAYEYSGGAATLTVRDRANGARRTISRDRWSFAREENGKPVADKTSVYMAAGFEPGRIYEMVYEAQDPWVIGLGPAAVRDLISYLRTTGGPMALGDQRRFLKRALGFGTSQSGRFLRTFLYYGFNADEKGKPVFDGVWSHVAGAARGSFNHRFAQPSRDGHPFYNNFYPTDIFPYTDLDQADPETGLTEGILTRTAKQGVTPKIFYTNGSYEYWGRAASLIHTTLDGKEDAPTAKDTRIYLLAGTQHGAGALPPRKNDTQNFSNPSDYRTTMRALLLAFNDWLKDNKEPPASMYPRIDKDQLVSLGALRFPEIPGVRLPRHIKLATRVDFGPRFRTEGIVAFEPPKIGKAFPVLLPQVDADGNETSGIRKPDITVPLATYTGWNLRAPEIGAPDEIFSMVGSYLPFPRTKAERQKTGDPRPSIEERYQSREDYLGKVKTAAKELSASGFLLDRDVAYVVDRAAKEWDYVMNGK